MPELKVSEKTFIPLGMAAIVLVAMLSMTTWLYGELGEIKTSLQMIRKDMQTTWTRTDMSIWAYQLKDRNQSIGIPDPNSITTGKQ